MKHRTYILLAALTLVAVGSRVCAQSLDDLNIQLHGYATQAFIYTNQNNWNTTDSSDGSPAWTEAVVNLSAQPTPRLTIGVQARYFLLGDMGNQLTLDWAMADYKIDKFLGFRAGKVKTPSGLLNETQDIDPAQLWVLLPQSIYPVASRNSILAHYGGVVYGATSLGERAGKLEYRGFAGERVISPDDGYFQAFRDVGFTLPDSMSFSVYGGMLQWKTPLPGLMLGASSSSQAPSGIIDAGSYPGTVSTKKFTYPIFFGRYERRRFMFAGEYNRIAVRSLLAFPGLYSYTTRTDQRSFYAMTTYKPTEKLSAGIYYSNTIDKQAAFTNSRYQKDWALATRYDINPFLYLKFEQHWLDGTHNGFNTSDNTGGLTPSTRMTLLKLGVSF